MKLIVIDASVALKWFTSQEPLRDEALVVLDHIQNAPQNYFVPELFFNEMLAVFCRLVKDAKAIERYLGLLENLGLSRVGNGSQILALASRIAVAYNVSGYDAVYAATAQLIGGVWLTADEKAYKKLSPLGVVALVHKN